MLMLSSVASNFMLYMSVQCLAALCSGVDPFYSLYLFIYLLDYKALVHTQPSIIVYFKIKARVIIN